MGLLVISSDFKGKFAIAKDSFTDIDSYIAKYEELYLVDLLGASLFALFKADVDSTTKKPETQIYLGLYDPIRRDADCGISISEGMKEMLLGFIYFEYVRDSKVKITVSGPTAGKFENSRESGFAELDIWNRYNSSISSYKTIQEYIKDNEEVYPTYNGQAKEVTYWV